jgi:hypothetical protein
MAIDANIVAALREIVKDPNGPNQPIIGTVTSVDESNNTCYVEPLDDSLPDYPLCRLMTDIDTGFLIIPAIDSQVTLISLGQGDSQIIQYSSLQSIQLNGISYGGLVVVQKLVDKINALENLVNQMIQNANVYVVAVPPGGGNVPFGGLFTPMVPPVPNTITQISPITSTASISSNYVMHGDGT